MNTKLFLLMLSIHTICLSSSYTPKNYQAFQQKLAISIQKNNTSEIKRLLLQFNASGTRSDKDFNFLNTMKIKHTTPLEYLIKKGNKEAVMYLLQLGVEANQTACYKAYLNKNKNEFIFEMVYDALSDEDQKKFDIKINEIDPMLATFNNLNI